MTAVSGNGRAIGRTAPCTMSHDDDGRRLPILGFGAAALSCKPRGVRSAGHGSIRPVTIAAGTGGRRTSRNERICVLPEKTRANPLLSLKRTRKDSVKATWAGAVAADRRGQTFVDPAGHRGFAISGSGSGLWVSRSLFLDFTLVYDRSSGRWFTTTGRIRYASMLVMLAATSSSGSQSRYRKMCTNFGLRYTGRRRGVNDGR